MPARSIRLVAREPRGADPAVAPEPVQEPSYLGQELLGMTPVVFAPGIVSTDVRELNAVFTPDGMVTPDGKYFFYTQGEDVYWLDAAILETYRPGE